jgi:hypothetical protein
MIGGGVEEIGGAGAASVGTDGWGLWVAPLMVTGGIGLIGYGGTTVAAGGGITGWGAYNMWEAIFGQ